MGVGEYEYFFGAVGLSMPYLDREREMKGRREKAKPTCEEVHGGGGQGPGDREWNGDWECGTGQLEMGGTGELG